MNPFLRYLLQRVTQYAVVVFVGITVAFIIPRFMPVDAIDIQIAHAEAAGGMFDPESVDRMRESLRELYGLEGTVLEQYVSFWSRLAQGDFGPSLSAFPTPVMVLIRRALPWTIGLLTIAVLISWTIGNIIGGLAGYFNKARWSNVMAVVSMCLFPVPYYIMALLVLALFTFVLPWFPLFGGAGIGITPQLSLDFIGSVLYHAFLPALSLVLIQFGVWFLTMRQLITRISGEDFVTYAKGTGQTHPRIMSVHVMRNAMLPQVTGLGLSLGQAFSGSLIAEFVFSYPGIGQLLYEAVLRGDVNLMIGIVTISVVAIATIVLVIDLVYPLLDPRVRYR